MDKIDFINSQQPAINDTNLNLMQENIERAINAQVSGDTLPIGTVLPFAGISIPENWLICDGSAVSRTTYSQLFNVISTRYGSGDGSTTFNLPNMKGRVPVGQDPNQTEFYSLGKTGGEKKHTLTIEEMPSHTHSIKSKQNGSGLGDGYPASASGYDYSISSAVVQNTGGGQPHNILQPYIVQRYIIKAFQTAGTVAQILNTQSNSTTDAYSANFINNLNTYSTTEKRIGTWINGKPIYRRVYDLGNLPNSDTKEISHGISNFGRLIRIYGNAYRSTDGFSVGLPYSYPTAETNIGLSVINDSIRVVTGVDRSNMTGYAVIEYTKTTD